MKQRVPVRSRSLTLERMLVGITSFFGKERTSQRLLVSQFLTPVGSQRLRSHPYKMEYAGSSPARATANSRKRVKVQILSHLFFLYSKESEMKVRYKQMPDSDTRSRGRLECTRLLSGEYEGSIPSGTT